MTEQRDTAHAFIKDTERRIAELSLVMRHVAVYRQLKLMYNRYRQSRAKEKFCVSMRARSSYLKPPLRG